MWIKNLSYHVQRCCGSFADKARNLLQLKRSHRITDSDIILRAEHLDVLVEFNRCAEVIRARAEGEGSVICEGYGLISDSLSYNEREHEETHRFRIDVPTPPASTSESATANILNLYGISTIDTVQAVQPSVNIWPDSQSSIFGPPDITQLVPPPPAVPPRGLQYPCAPTYQLNETRDNRWRRGYYYWTTYHPADADKLYHRMMATTTPPNTVPTVGASGKYIYEPIPGMVQMPAGIPFVEFIGGDCKKPVTIACLQTMESLSQYDEVLRIQHLVDELGRWSWGCPERNGIPARRPIFELDGLKQNDRSAKGASKTSSNDGSYNLASTILQGNGVGVTQPAVQSVSPEAKVSISSINKILAELYRLVLPTCVSKEELDVTDFHAIDNNIFCIGGLPSNTSIQLNISSTRLGGSLAEAIGAQSGWWHSDSGDDPTRWTLFTLLFCLPPGSDPGAFMLGRPGLYIRELDICILFLVFKGNDLHSGFSPMVDATKERAWHVEMLQTVALIYNMVGPENRCGYVSYPSNVACHRLGAMSITPSLTFGNAGANPARKDIYMDYARHGLHLVGARAHYNRLAREVVYHQHNFAQHTGLQGLPDPADALRSMTYVDENNFTAHCDPVPFHAVHDAALLTHWRGRYKYHYLNCHAYRINIVKHRYKTTQLKLKNVAQPSKLTSIPTLLNQRTGIPRWSHKPIDTTGGKDAGVAFSYTDIFGRPNSPLSVCPDSPSSVCLELEHDQDALAVAPTSLELHNNQTMQTAESAGPAAQYTSPLHPVPITAVQSTASNLTSTQATSSKKRKFIDDNTESEYRHPMTGGFITSSNDKGTNSCGDDHDLESSNKPNDVPMDVDCPDDGLDNVEDDSGVGEDDEEDREEDDEEDYKEDNEEDLPVDDTDIEYDVEEVLDRRVMNKNVQYYIKWKDYDEPEWVFHATMKGCTTLIRQYLAHHRLSKDTDIDNVNGGSSNPVTLCTSAIRSLEAVLSPSNLLNDRHLLPSIASSSSITQWAPANIISSILRQRSEGQQVDDLSHQDLNDLNATTIFSHIVSTVATLSTFAPTVSELSLTKCFMSWEIARSLSIIARWYIETGPMLAECLFETRQQHTETSMKALFPSFAGLVEHILKYLGAIYNSKPVASGRKRARIMSDDSIQDVNSARRVPMSVFGSDFSEKDSFLLPSVEHHLIGCGTESRSNFGQQLFIQTISNVFISPGLDNIDAYFNGSQRRQDSAKSLSKLNVLEGCVKRTIIRGSVIDVIVEACGGDDGVLASSAIDHLLRSPAFLFNTTYNNNDDKVAKKLLRNPHTTLAPLRKWLADYIASSPNTLVEGRHLGDAIYKLMCQCHGSQPFPRFNPLQSIAKAKRRVPFGSKPTKSPSIEIIDCPLTLHALIDKPEDDLFSSLGIIIRECLNRRRSLPDGDSHISRIMCGQHATTGRARDNDLDHFDPIRLDNVYAKMLRTQFPAEHITGHLGLSNLLVWMLTGQGYATREFCNHNNLWFTSLSSCIQTFRDAHSQIDGPKCYNTQIWGTACASFALETAMFTIEEKFTPLFSEAVVDAWKTFLGTSYQSTYTSAFNQLPSFADALDMISRLCKKVNINGIRTGLTRLQLANNLASLGLCQPPTVSEIAGWIHKNQTKGAFRGLVLLGFNIEGRPAHWTKAAFQLVLDHLESTLCLQDKNLLFFGTIFLEHILCKVSRFTHLIRAASHGVNGLSLKQIGQQAAKAQVWLSGANVTDKTGQLLPIPAQGVLVMLEASVQLWL